MQELVTEACWGSIWTRPGLERKHRSLLNIAMLCALNRSNELAVHVRGAVNNGASEVEIRETLLQVAIYCGMRMFNFPFFLTHSPESRALNTCFKVTESMS
jgi:4-carboxymuconolactone decarboxylase